MTSRTRMMTSRAGSADTFFVCGCVRKVKEEADGFDDIYDDDDPVPDVDDFPYKNDDIKSGER